MKVQPLKIILINSANCQYAEFDLSDSLHLVALNNRGKTSIINTLQFLYVDNYKGLDMGHTLDKTWRHYFPQLGSYILFELNTLTGKKVFGLAATGMGDQPEKFILDGSYQSVDFIEQKDKQYIPRKPEKLFPLLGARLLKRNLGAKDHRDLLKPFQSKKNPTGLGVIGDTNDYSLFKRLLKQLLQLKGITIKDLKEQIEQVNQRVMEKEQIINVQREFNEPYSDIQKRQGELQRLRSNHSYIEELLYLNERQTSLRGRLRNYSLKADKLFVDEDQRLESEKESYTDTRQRLQDEQLPSIQFKKDEKQQISDSLKEKRGVLKRDIGDYEKLEKTCKEIVVELEQSKHSNLNTEATVLQKQLYQAEEADLGQLEKSLRFKQRKQEEYRIQLKHIADTLFVRLKALLDDQQLQCMYQLTNGELWTLLDGQGFELHNADALKRFLQQSLKEDNRDDWELPGLKLKLSSVSVSGLQKLGNPDFLHDKIEGLQNEINTLQQQIGVVKEQEKLRQQLEEIQKQIGACESQLDQYQQWQQGQDQYRQWLDERERLNDQIEKYRDEIDLLDEHNQELKEKIRQYEESIARTVRDQETLNQQKSWIEKHPPDKDWKSIEVNYETVTFADLYEQYEKHYKELQQKTSDINRKLSQLRDAFPNMAGLNDEAALHFLREQLEAIPEKEKNIHDQWKGIFTSFAAHCRGMIESVEAIDSYLADLNRLLSKQQISNLNSVKIRLETNQWHRHIRNIMDWREDDLPLFGGVDEAQGEKLQHAIKPLLEKVKISIADLYDLKLLVVDQHDQEKQYDSLQLESNGTSITVKTIIFISMLNKAMEGKQRLGENVRIPFYVDEIDSLDDVNAQNIHDTAQKLGLIPVFASPKGSGICKRLYQLDNNHYGKVSVRQKVKGKLWLSKPTFERLEVN